MNAAAGNASLDFNDAITEVSLPRHDLNAVRSALRHNAEAVLHYLYPHGRQEGPQVGRRGRTGCLGR
ncbi:MAG: hypothetical protein NT123_21705 [Proteobacteria bacterium]|nr:hypothetical protein [Pseudomonadota bacterium]